jgi:tetratricopeptide (TPR) repeat protein
MEDLDEAIAYHREALTLCPIGCPSCSTVHKELSLHPDRSNFLSNLANAIFTRYEQSGSMKDLEEVITYNREALNLHPPDHPYRSTSLDDLAIAILIRYDQSGYSSMKDFEEGITYHREALRLRPAGHPDRSISLINLVNAFYQYLSLPLTFLQE